MFYPLTGTRSSDASGKRMREVACPICTVHLQVCRCRCYNSFKIHSLVFAYEHGTTNLPCSRSKFQLLVQRRSSVAYVSILSSSAPVEVCCHAGVFSDSRTESPVQSSLLLTPGDPPCLHGVLCSVLYMNESKSFANLVVMLWSKQGWIRVCIP